MEARATVPDPRALFNARLIAREDLNEALILFRVAYENCPVPPYEPGQFVNLGLPPRIPEHAQGESGLVKRPYSVSSIPSEDSIEFFVRLVDNGALTPSLFALEIGSRLWMEERFVGKFTLANLPDSPAPTERDLVLISTGTGLAPFMSMLRHFKTGNMWRRLVMINGVRIESDLGYREELVALERKHPWLRYIPVLSRVEKAPPGGLLGRVDKALDPGYFEGRVGAQLDPRYSQVMLCGNPEMLDSVQALLEQRGFKRHLRKDPGQIHLERYW